MSMKMINGKFYGYNEETNEYYDWITKKPVKISDKKSKESDTEEDKQNGSDRTD